LFKGEFRPSVVNGFLQYVRKPAIFFVAGFYEDIGVSEINKGYEIGNIPVGEMDIYPFGVKTPIDFIEISAVVKVDGITPKLMLLCLNRLASLYPTKPYP
jgi:hypothetical protein